MRTSTGSISGQVTLNGQGVNLASVVAISPSGPAVSTLTNPDGTYRISGLAPQQYLVYVHPLPPAQFGETYPANVFPPTDANRREIPAALNFFVNYGADVVEQLWSIDKYFKFVLLLMFSTGLAFQIPIVQVLLGVLGIVSSKQMLSGWRYVVLGAAVLGAVLTPSTDPLTQSLLGGAVLALYFGGVGLVKLLGR